MASTFAVSPVRTKFADVGSVDPHIIDVPRRRRKETVNERVEHILRGALRDAEEEALQEREGDPKTRGQALQRSHQLASLYTTSTQNKFLRARTKRDALSHRNATKEKRDCDTSLSQGKSHAKATIFEEGEQSDECGDDSSSGARRVLTSPIKSLIWSSSDSDRASEFPVSMSTSPVKTGKPWYGCSPSATLNQQIPLGITLDAKLRRYGACGTAKLVHGWRSREALAPIPPSNPVIPVDEFTLGLSGSPSLWPPEAFHPTGSCLRVTMTRCPSSPIAVSVGGVSDGHSSITKPCHSHAATQAKLQQIAATKLQTLYKREKRIALEEQVQNQRDISEWQRKTLHFQPPSELVAHLKQQENDPQLRHRRTQVSAIVQTPGYSPEKQRSNESSQLKNKRFPLRWCSFARLMDAMRRTPCRRPVLQDIDKLFALARELGDHNVLGTCMLSRGQFTLLMTREFPLCDLKHVNRLFSSYDWELRDLVDARVVLGAIRAMRVQQGEPVDLVCATLRDFGSTTDVNGKNITDDSALVSGGISLIKALSLCCSSDSEEDDMKTRAELIWAKTLLWQRQILSRRVHGGAECINWRKQSPWSSVASNDNGIMSDKGEQGEQTSNCDDDNDAREDDVIEEIPELIHLVNESRVPIRRIRAALQRERETLAIFTQQLLQRRHECMIAATTRSPRR
ncbi:unnamed protein product [Phytophthora fragariaefolia]|uniref:Unnamed protein product n=1 Tax=Phytophthora fragariaefolia TaxID=1490495 RepID=A0A9W6YCB3_9STRA|nr:unnamed protein product [Phytophthora fragariaefolia]